VSLLQICLAIAKLGAVLNRPDGSGFAVVSPFAIRLILSVMPTGKPVAFAGTVSAALLGIIPG
jgi:hypothetical protein